MYSVVLYCITLYCIVLYFYSIVLYCIVLYYSHGNHTHLSFSKIGFCMNISNTLIECKISTFPPKILTQTFKFKYRLHTFLQKKKKIKFFYEEKV